MKNICQVALASLVILGPGCEPTATDGTLRASILSFLYEIRLIEKKGLPPIDIHVLLDASAGSSATPETAEETVAAAVDVAVSRPGSSIHLWLTDTTVAALRHLEDFQVSEPERSDDRYVRAHQEDMRLEAQTKLKRAWSEGLLGHEPDRSPLFGSISKISLAFAPPNRRRLLLIVSDGREFSDAIGDWECQPLPEPDELWQVLQDRGLLREGSLENTVVGFSHVEITAVDGDRCAVTLSHEYRMRDLWRSTLLRAGAVTVEFAFGSPELDRLLQPVSPNR